VLDENKKSMLRGGLPVADGFRNGICYGEGSMPNQRRFVMDTPNEGNRSGEPLMRSVEDLEQRAYPGESRGEVMRDEAIQDERMDDTGTAGIVPALPGPGVPIATGQPAPPPAVLPFDTDADGNYDDSDEARRTR
jgi:hypothetical protein